ncbi:MAG: hypothetical protein ACLQUY_28675 [Ktedonobacterales bacterium]
MSKRATAQAADKAPRSRSRPRPHILSDRVWLVLARQVYNEPLRQVGTVEADDVELAKVYAESIYDEFAWIEMVLVPRDTTVTVIAS